MRFLHSWRRFAQSWKSNGRNRLAGAGRSPRGRTPRLGLEALEDRRLLAVSITPENTAHMIIQGDNASDQIQVDVVTMSGTEQVRIRHNAMTAFRRFSAVATIQVLGGGGDDTITVDGTVAAAIQSVTVDGQGGSNNTLNANGFGNFFSGHYKIFADRVEMPT